MALLLTGVVLACLAASGGLTLATCHFTRLRPPRWLLVAHPLAGITALVCLWIVFALWQGPRDLPLDAGMIVLMLTFVAGAFMFSLRLTRLPVSGFAVVVHGVAGLFGCALLIVGLFHVGAG